MKRAWIAAVVMLAASCAAGSADSQSGSSALRPDDFARGLEIDAAPGAFFRLDVPDFVFAETAWPDLRDLRVFNQASEAVPFARVTPTSAEGEVTRVALRSFRIESMSPGSLPRVELDALKQGVELRVSPGRPGEAGVEYLLAVATPNLATPIHRLLLEWEDRDTNWRQTVNVFVSTDLETWSTVAVGRPLLDLKTADGSRLRHAEITVEPRVPESARYWKLQFGRGDAPVLTTVDGETRAMATPLPGVRLPMSSPVAQDGAAVYELASSQPLARLRIIPGDPNSVLPLVLEARAQGDDAWTFIARTVAYRLNNAGAEQFSDPIVLRGRPVKSVRLKPLGTSWGSAMPQVEVERDPLSLVVNARGAGPFLLAWGSRAASDDSVPFGQLVPKSTSERLAEIPPAQPRSVPRELGGPARLTALAPGERAARWQTTLVWLVLVGGAAALALLAVRVWREARVREDPS